MAICNDCGEENRPGTGKIGSDFVITLDIASADKNVTLQNAPEILLGRFEDGHPGEPCVDFSDDGALDKGVSRLHASIKRRDHQVLIVDRGSSNGTLVNGQRIGHREEIILYDGDEIHLGKLAVKIYIG